MIKDTEIVNNLGKKVMVNERFANAFKKAKAHSKSLGEKFGEFNEVPIEEFNENTEEDKPIKKGGLEQWL